MSSYMVKLGSVAETSSGGTPQRGVARFYGGEIPWVKSGELPDGPITITEESVTEAGLSESNAKLFPAGTLLIAMYGATVGKLGILQMPAATNQAVCAIVPSQKLDRDYLFYWLFSIREELAKASFGGAQPNISQGLLRDLNVPLRSVLDQQRIAKNLKNQLAAAEEARQAAQSQLNEIRLLKTQALKTVFAAIEDISPLGDVARIQSGYAFKSEAFQKQGVRLLRNANVSPGRVYWDDAVYIAPSAAKAHTAYALTDGDVLISLDRPIISTGIKVARVAPTDLPALLVQRVGRFRIDETRLNADYLYAFLHTEPFIEAISGHEQSLGVPHISPGQIEAIDIPLPTLAEQQRLAVILNNIAKAAREAQIAAELQLRDIELLPSRLLAAVFDAPAAL